MPYRLRYGSRALRALKKLGERDRTTIIAALEELASGRSPAADVRKLRGVSPTTWPLRIGRFRALYRPTAGEIVAVDVDDRKDVYRR